MALTVSVVKKEVGQQMDGLWNIILTLTCMDGAVEAFTEDFSIRYRTGQDPEVRVKAILDDMQAAIDEYKAEQAIFDHTKLDAAVTWLNTNLVG